MGQNILNRTQKISIKQLPDIYIRSTLDSSLLQHPEQSTLRQYIVLLNPTELTSYSKHLFFRQQHQDHLIQICYGEEIQNDISYYKFKVYMQYIPIRLHQLKEVHFIDLISIIYRVLFGFYELYKYYGYFEIQPNMIGFLQNGKCKVWCNNKLTKYYSKISYNIIKNDQEVMIDKIKSIFYNKIDSNSIPNNYKLQGNTFQNCIKSIQNYVADKQKIPNKIYSIIHLINSGRRIISQGIYNLKNQIYHKKLQKVIKIQYQTPKRNFKVSFNQNANIDPLEQFVKNSQEYNRGKISSIGTTSDNDAKYIQQ